MPEWFQCEGIESVLDRLQAAGVSALGLADPKLLDIVKAAIAEFLGFTDEPVADGATLHYPSPTTAHPVGAHAQSDKIMQAQQAAGNVPVIAFAHSYGPEVDVHERIQVALKASSGQARAQLWLNRYGYLSDAKLENLSRLMLSQKHAA